MFGIEGYCGVVVFLFVVLGVYLGDVEFFVVFVEVVFYLCYFFGYLDVGVGVFLVVFDEDVFVVFVVEYVDFGEFYWY